MGQSDDWDLLKQHSAQALHCLFERHRDFVFRVAFSRLGAIDSAEDVTQDVFLTLLKQRKPLFRGAKFRTWLFRVTSNAAIDRLRKRGRVVALDERYHQQGFNEPYAERITLQEVVALLDQLPPRQRDTVVLREFEGMSTAETAQTLGISTGSVKTHLHRGIARLRQLLEGSTTQNHFNRTEPNKEIKR